MNDPVRRDTILTMLGFSLTLAAFLFGIHFPGKQRIEHWRGEIAQAQAKLTEVPVRLAEIESLQRQKRECEAYLATTDSLLTAADNLAGVISDVARLAENHQLQVTRLEPLPPAENATYRQIRYRLSFQGSYPCLCAFLQGLEESEPLYAVSELSLHRGERQNGDSIAGDLYFSAYANEVKNNDFNENDSRLNAASADTRNRLNSGGPTAAPMVAG